ncbi:MAG: T9SS type A sorting domain-containing protein, partial [Bacteroidales bacterium]|nr:T9SS type A sorting domain-containing protein [Bacteroidales bacterium]
TTLEGSVTVVVEDMPDQAATPEGETDMCWGVFQTVYQTLGAEGASSYNWMLEPETAGSIAGAGMTATVTWDETFVGTAQVMVEGMNDCGAGAMSVSLEINMHELPLVDLGADMTVCANETILLDAGNPGSTYLWSTGETTQTIQIDTTGVGIGSVIVSVLVTDGNTCESSDEITIQFDDCTGVTELSEKWAVEVYPNPSDGIFSVELNSVNGVPVSLVIYNTMGRKIFEQENISVQSTKTINLDLNTIPEGIYMLNIKGNGINMMRKIIIQK